MIFDLMTLFSILLKNNRDTLLGSISKKLDLWEQKLIQPNQKTFQDVINFNNQLNAQFMHLKSYVDGADPEVTEGALKRLEDLNKYWNELEKNLNEIINSDVKKFNELYKSMDVPSLIIPSN